MLLRSALTVLHSLETLLRHHLAHRLALETDAVRLVDDAGYQVNPDVGDLVSVALSAVT